MPSQISESDFIRKADDLLKDAENRAKALGEGDTFVKDNLKLVDEAKSLHAEGKDSDAYAKYAEALEKIEAAETSVNSEPLARKLLSIQFVYLAVLLFLAYGTRKWPYFGLWSGLVVHDTQTAWFGALGGVSIGIYGIYDHIRKRDLIRNTACGICVNQSSERSLAGLRTWWFPSDCCRLQGSTKFQTPNFPSPFRS